MILSKEQALRVSKRTFAVIKVPELDGELRLASLSAGPSLEFNSLRNRKMKGEDVDRPMMLVLIEAGIVDEQGNRLFDAESAAKFLDCISLETMSLITSSIPMAAPSQGAVPPGNSPASPVAA